MVGILEYEGDEFDLGLFSLRIYCVAIICKLVGICLVLS